MGYGSVGVYQRFGGLYYLHFRETNVEDLFLLVSVLTCTLKTRLAFFFDVFGNNVR
jgi:hypothetical protein